MKRAPHPFVLFAPYAALAAFGGTAVLGVLRHATPLTLVIRCIIAFYAAYLLVRFCASLLSVAPARPERSGDAGASGEPPS